MTISEMHPSFVVDGHRRVGVDLEAAEMAVADLLLALGQDLDTEDLRDTPRRVATALADLLTPPPFSLTTFANEEEYDEMVVVRDIPFQSLCAHHLLPFIGVAHVAYVPGARIVGLSKLARVVEHFAHRPQVQERLTSQVADALDARLAPRGVGVALEATHLCMSLRGVRATGARTRTTAMRGVVRDDPVTRSEFSTLVNEATDARRGGNFR
jgi:GTP cyclohydrolase IA